MIRQIRRFEAMPEFSADSDRDEEPRQASIEAIVELQLILPGNSGPPLGGVGGGVADHLTGKRIALPTTLHSVA